MASETFQITPIAAETYETQFVPGIFAEWATLLVDAAGIGTQRSVLDVACGTGIVARTAADRLGGDARVVGLDLNEAMLDVARRVRPEIEWRQGDAADLPFPDDSFDVVLCQMALMFFRDRLAAVREMARVVAADGVVGLVVPDTLSAQPAYGPFVDVAVRHAGPKAATLLGAYWECGDPDELRGLVTSAGLGPIGVVTRLGTARFPTVDAFVATEVEGSPLRDRISDAEYAGIRADSRTVLAPFTAPDGSIAAPLSGHVVLGRPSAD